MVSVNWEEEESTELLQKIIEHWVTVCGFSFAGAFLEKYKYIRRVFRNQKALERSCKLSFYLFIYY